MDARPCADVMGALCSVTVGAGALFVSLPGERSATWAPGLAPEEGSEAASRCAAAARSLESPVPFACPPMPAASVSVARASSSVRVASAAPESASASPVAFLLTASTTPRATDADTSAPLSTSSVGSAAAPSAFDARAARRVGFACSTAAPADASSCVAVTAASTASGNSNPESVPCLTSICIASTSPRVGSSGKRSSVLSSRGTSVSCARRCTDWAARASLFSVSVETVDARRFVDAAREERGVLGAAESAIGNVRLSLRGGFTVVRVSVVPSHNAVWTCCNFKAALSHVAALLPTSFAARSALRRPPKHATGLRLIAPPAGVARPIRDEKRKAKSVQSQPSRSTAVRVHARSSTHARTRRLPR